MHVHIVPSRRIVNFICTCPLPPGSGSSSFDQIRHLVDVPGAAEVGVVGEGAAARHAAAGRSRSPPNGIGAPPVSTRASPVLISGRWSAGATRDLSTGFVTGFGGVFGCRLRRRCRLDISGAFAAGGATGVGPRFGRRFRLHGPPDIGVIPPASGPVPAGRARSSSASRPPRRLAPARGHQDDRGDQHAMREQRHEHHAADAVAPRARSRECR